MGTAEVVPSEWVFFEATLEGKEETGYQEIYQDGSIAVRMQKHPLLGVRLPHLGARRLYASLRDIFEPTDKLVAESLPRVIEHLEKELAALKDQRRWELYLALTEKFFGTGPNYLLGEKVQSFAIDVDKHVKAYVNTVMPAEQKDG
jgi:hypothetical protein